MEFRIWNWRLERVSASAVEHSKYPLSPKLETYACDLRHSRTIFRRSEQSENHNADTMQAEYYTFLAISNISVMQIHNLMAVWYYRLENG